MDIHFVIKDDLNIQINTNNRDYITAIDKHLTDFVKGYRFMPKYKRGGWNGQISIFNRPNRSFPYGLLFEVIKYTKKEWNDLDLVISPDIKKMYKGLYPSEIKYNLTLTPYPYQQECIETLLKSSKGIVEVATAGGKSLIIAYIIDNINKTISYNNSLIIVPTLQLVDQFKGDLIEYGINKINIGIVNSKHKEFDEKIVISTWQSLKNQMNELDRFNTVIVDEVHTASANKLSEILQNCKGAEFRYGVTGTIPTNRLDRLNVLSYLGPVLKKYTGKDLADLGYVSECVINQIYINYQKKYTGSYNDIKDEIFFNEYRLGLIKHIIQEKNNSVLILIDKIEKEGEPLLEILKESFPDKEIIFLSGRDKSDVRDLWRKKMNDRKDIVCIATYPIFQQGVNIPSLRTIILGSSTKSYIRVIQSLGRVLRKHVSKEYGGAELYDICDNIKYMKDHSMKRNRHYVKEKHNIKEIVLNEESGLYKIN